MFPYDYIQTEYLRQEYYTGKLYASQCTNQEAIRPAALIVCDATFNYLGKGISTRSLHCKDTF